MDFLKLKAVLGLDSSEYEQGLNKAKSLAGNVGGVISNGLMTAAKIGGAAIATATAAVGAFATSSVKAGADFDKSMSQVAATMGITIEELNDSSSQASQNFQKLRDFAQEMGRTTAFSATEAADALNYMALAGYDTQTSIEMLPNVLNLAAAGSMDLAMASDMVTDTQSALGLSLRETSDMVDQMAKASSKTNTSVSQLGEAMLTIGATARGVAGGTVELSTVLGVLADNGIKGAEGGTHLRNAILSLQTPTKDGVAALAELGMTYDDMYDSAGNLRSLPEIFQEMSTAMDGMNQQSKDAIISGVFNKTDLAAVNALINTNAERWDEVTTAIEDSKGAAQKMADTQLDNLTGDMTLFKSALEGAKIAVSDGLTPSLRKFVQFGTSGLSTLTTAFKEGGLTGAMEAFGDTIADGINMIVDMAPQAIKAGMKLLGAVGQGILDNLPAIVDASVQIVVELANGLVNALPELARGVVTLIESLKTSFSENKETLINTGRELLTFIVNGLANNLPAMVEGITQMISGMAIMLSDSAILSPLIEGAINIILALAEGLLHSVPILIETIPVIIENLVNALIDNAPTLILSAISLLGMIAQSIIENLPLIIAAGIQIITALTTGIIQMIPFIITAVLGLISEVTRTLVASLPKFIENGIKIVGAIVEGIVKTLGAIIEAAINLVNQFIDGLARGWGKIIQAGMDIINNVRDGIMDKIDEARDWGKDLIDNFIDGIEAKAQALWDTVSGIAQGVKDFLGFSEPEKGPLSNFHTYAPDMMDLFAKGVRDNKNMLLDTVADAFNFQDLITAPEINTEKADANTNTNQETNVIINVYGAAGQSVEELAEIVSEKINNATNRRMVAMGVSE